MKWPVERGDRRMVRLLHGENAMLYVRSAIVVVMLILIAKHGIPLVLMMMGDVQTWIGVR